MHIVITTDINIINFGPVPITRQPGLVTEILVCPTRVSVSGLEIFPSIHALLSE